MVKFSAMGKTKPKVCTGRLELYATRELVERLQAVADGRSVARPRVVRAGLALVCQELNRAPEQWAVVSDAELELLASPLVAEAVRRGELTLRRAKRINFSATLEIEELLATTAARFGVRPTRLAVCALAYACKILDDDPTPRALRLGLPPEFEVAELSVMPLAVAHAEKKRARQVERAKETTRRRRRHAARRSYKAIQLQPVRKRRAATANLEAMTGSDGENR